MTEFEKAVIFVALKKALDEVTANDEFLQLGFEWQEDTTEKMALAALKALQKEMKDNP